MQDNALHSSKNTTHLRCTGYLHTASLVLGDGNINLSVWL